MHPTYNDPFTGEAITYIGRSCLGDISAEHTPARENQKALRGLVALIHESGLDADEMAAAYGAAVRGDHGALQAARATRASFRARLAEQGISICCPNGAIVVRDPRDPPVVWTQARYGGVGVTMREYLAKGTQKGRTHSELAGALRGLAGDAHSGPPTAPDSTVFDAIMS